MKKIGIKIGGGSVSGSDQVKIMPSVLGRHSGSKIILTLSAFGKTTRSLESLAMALSNHEDQEVINEMIKKIYLFHKGIAERLFPLHHVVFEQINDIFDDIRKIASWRKILSFPAFSDQIVSLGEVLAVLIDSWYLSGVGINNIVMPAYDYVKTNDYFTNAKVDVEKSLLAIRKEYEKVFTKTDLIETHGYIGGTEFPLKNSEGINFKLRTTLGTNTSDYTAALFSVAMKVEEVIYYKNVPGLMDKDPLVPGGEGAVLFKNLSYEQAQEIIGKGTGRGLLHELSIPLLQRYGIPIWIKDFNNPDAHGTRIGN